MTSLLIRIYFILFTISYAVLVGAFVPLFGGGNVMPKIYDGWFNDQIAKQASNSVGKAIAAGKKKIEVNFPPVPNVEEVKFGTPLNQKFGVNVIAKDLKVKGGYRPGSELSRNLIGFSNIYWAKKLAGACGGGFGGKGVAVLSSERVLFKDIGNLGGISRSGVLMSASSRKSGKSGEAIIAVNPGGDETWKRVEAAHASPGSPIIILNNAYSTSYDLGNKQGFEEAYYLKRISKGWVYRAFPNPWQVYLETPDGKVELLESFKSKPSLRDCSTLVREESFKRFAINNDRWAQGFGGRL